MLSEKTKAMYMADLDYFSSLLEQNPTGGLHLPVVALYNRLNRYSEALTVARQGLEINPNYPQLQVLLAEALINEGVEDEALEVLMDAITYDDDNYKALKMLGILFKNQNMSKESLAYIQSAYLKAPEDPQLLAILEEFGSAELKYIKPIDQALDIAEPEEDYPEEKVQDHLEKADTALAYFKDYQPDSSAETDESISDEELLAALNMGEDVPPPSIESLFENDNNAVNAAPLELFPPLEASPEIMSSIGTIDEPKAPEISLDNSTGPAENTPAPIELPAAEPIADIEAETPELLYHPIPSASELATADDEEDELELISPIEDTKTEEDVPDLIHHPIPSAIELVTMDDDDEDEFIEADGEIIDEKPLEDQIIEEIAEDEATLEEEKPELFHHPIPKASELVTEDEEDLAVADEEQTKIIDEVPIEDEIIEEIAEDEATLEEEKPELFRHPIPKASELVTEDEEDLAVADEEQTEIIDEEPIEDEIIQEELIIPPISAPVRTVEEAHRQMYATPTVEAFPANNILLGGSDSIIGDTEVHFERLFTASRISADELNKIKGDGALSYSVEELMRETERERKARPSSSTYYNITPAIEPIKEIPEEPVYITPMPNIAFEEPMSKGAVLFERLFTASRISPTELNAIKGDEALSYSLEELLDSVDEDEPVLALESTKQVAEPIQEPESLIEETVSPTQEPENLIEEVVSPAIETESLIEEAEPPVQETENIPEEPQSKTDEVEQALYGFIPNEAEAVIEAAIEDAPLPATQSEPESDVGEIEQALYGFIPQEAESIHNEAIEDAALPATQSEPESDVGAIEQALYGFIPQEAESIHNETIEDAALPAATSKPESDVGEIEQALYGFIPHEADSTHAEPIEDIDIPELPSEQEKSADEIEQALYGFVKHEAENVDEEPETEAELSRPLPDLKKGLASVSSLVDALMPHVADVDSMSLQEKLSMLYNADSVEVVGGGKQFDPHALLEANDEMVNILRASLDNNAAPLDGSDESLKLLTDILSRKPKA